MTETPEEQAKIDLLDEALPQTTTIKKILNNQQTMIKGFEDEREFNESKFEEGSEKFKELFGELKEVRSEVKDMKAQISDGFKSGEDKLENYITEVKDKRYEDIVKKMEAVELKEEKSKEKKEERKTNIQSQIIVGLVILLLGAVVTMTVNYVTENNKRVEIQK